MHTYDERKWSTEEIIFFYFKWKYILSGKLVIEYHFYYTQNFLIFIFHINKYHLVWDLTKRNFSEFVNSLQRKEVKVNQ